MKKYPIVIICVIGLILFLGLYYRAHPLVTQLEIHGHTFTVELAVTPEEKTKGLGYRDSLAEDTGMLFVYDHPEQYGFWMKGMRFPIDILWISDKTIVDITKNVPVATDDFLPTYTPKLPVNQIFEINAGQSDGLGIQIGDTVKILR